MAARVYAAKGQAAQLENLTGLRFHGKDSTLNGCAILNRLLKKNHCDCLRVIFPTESVGLDL